MSRAVDLTGRVFGRLTALRRVENQVSKSGRKRARWLCKCACGAETLVTHNSLTGKGSHHTISCGCAKQNSGRRPKPVKGGPEIQPAHRLRAAAGAAKTLARERRLAAAVAVPLTPAQRPAPTWRGAKAAVLDLAAVFGLANGRGKL